MGGSLGGEMAAGRGLVVLCTVALWASALEVSTLNSGSHPADYVEIHQPEARELSTMSDLTLAKCEHACSLMVKCKAVKFLPKEKTDVGSCTLLGAPVVGKPARNGVRAHLQAAQAQAEHIAKQAEEKVKQLKQEIKKSAQTTHKLRAETAQPVHKTTEITIQGHKDFVKEAAVPLRLDPLQMAVEAEHTADKRLKELRNPPEKRLPTDEILQRLMAAQTSRYVCEFSQKLRKTYIPRVKQEVERSVKEDVGRGVPSSVHDKIKLEVDRANEIVSRRAHREAKRKLKFSGDDLKQSVLVLLKAEGGYKKAIKLIKSIERKGCKIPKIFAKDVPKITGLDTFSNCAELKQYCGTSSEIRKKCGATCKEV